MKKCENCVWAVWSYGEVVECCGCDDPCPTEEDFAAANRNDCLAVYGMAEEEGDM